MTEAVRSEINIEMNSKPAQHGMSAAECDALVETVRSTPGWWAERHGDMRHRYLFVWRWWVQETAVLFCYSAAHWRALHAGIEKQLGPGTDPRKVRHAANVAKLEDAATTLKKPSPPGRREPTG